MSSVEDCLMNFHVYSSKSSLGSWVNVEDSSTGETHELFLKLLEPNDRIGLTRLVDFVYFMFSCANFLLVQRKITDDFINSPNTQFIQ